MTNPKVAPRWAREIRELVSRTVKADLPECLWNILAAIRGPDSGDEGLKEATCAKVRNKVCPNLTDEVNAIREAGEPELPPYDDVRWAFGNIDAHFLKHQGRAVIALRRLGYSPKLKDK